MALSDLAGLIVFTGVTVIGDAGVVAGSTGARDTSRVVETARACLVPASGRGCLTSPGDRKKEASSKARELMEI